MGSETVGTLVVVGVMVAVLAAFLLLIGLGLQRLSFTLGTIVVGLRAIRMQTQPVGDVLGGVLEDVTRMESDLGGVVEVVGQEMGGVAAVAPPEMDGDLDEEAGYDGDGEDVEAGDDAPEMEPLRLNIRPQVRVPARR